MKRFEKEKEKENEEMETCHYQSDIVMWEGGMPSLLIHRRITG